MRQAEFQHVYNVPRSRQRLRRRQRHETPVLVVIVKPRIEHPCHAKSPCPRHQPKRRQSSLRACQRHVVARLELPLVGQLLSHQQTVDPLAVRREIQVPRCQLLQHFIPLLFARHIDPFRHHPARLATKRQQHRLVNRRRHGTHSLDFPKLFGERLVILDSPGTRPRQRYVRCHAQQAILQGFPEAAVHRQRNHQCGDARSHSQHGKQCNQSQYGGSVRRSQVPPRHHPFESHGAAYPYAFSPSAAA